MFWKKPATEEIRSDALAALIQKRTPLVLVDVRSEKDYQAGHIPSAVNIPLSEFPEKASTLDPQSLTVFY